MPENDQKWDFKLPKPGDSGYFPFLITLMAFGKTREDAEKILEDLRKNNKPYNETQN